MTYLPTLEELGNKGKGAILGGAILAAVSDALRDEAARIRQVQRAYTPASEAWDGERAATHAVLSAAAEVIDRLRILAEHDRAAGRKPPMVVLLAADVARSALILDLQRTSYGAARAASEPADDGGDDGAAAA
jgi:hypothetical protein